MAILFVVLTSISASAQLANPQTFGITFQGSVSPLSNQSPFTLWMNTGVSPYATLTLFDGTQNVAIGSLNPTTHTWSPSGNASSNTVTAINASGVSATDTLANRFNGVTNNSGQWQFGEGISELFSINYAGAVNSPANSILWYQGAISGSVTAPFSGAIAPLQFFITSDTSPTGQDVMAITHASSPGMGSGRNIFVAYDTIVGVPATTGNHTAVTGSIRNAYNLLGTGGSYSTYASGLFGGNNQIIMQSGSTFVQVVSALENDIECDTGCSMAEENGLSIVHTSGHAVRAVYQDAAIDISDQDNASDPGWKFGFLFGAYAHQWAFAADSTLIGAVVRSVGASSPSIALNGVDFTAVTFQSGGCAFKSTGFCVDPSGNATVAAGTFNTGAASPILLNNNGASYNCFSLSGTCASAGIIGFYGGGTGDGAMYLEATTGFSFYKAGSPDVLLAVLNSTSLTINEALSVSGGLTASGAFTANGSTVVALSNIAPSGAHATVQEWLTISDGTNTRYIPAF